MLSGTADLGVLARGCPQLGSFAGEAVVLGDVETLQVLCEIESSLAQELLPPGLHPTIPGVVSWMVQRFADSPWGPFSLAQTRIECRSGVRPRGFLVGAVVDGDEARRALETRWGYRCRAGVVRLRRHYDEILGVVGDDDLPELAVGLRDPTPLDGDYVQYVANMNLAETPSGLRLLQVDPGFDLDRSERGDPEVHDFDGEVWGVPELEATYPISASFTVGSVTLPPVRFVCRPDVTAFEGTERV